MSELTDQKLTYDIETMTRALNRALARAAGEKIEVVIKVNELKDPTHRVPLMMLSVRCLKLIPSLPEAKEVP